MGGSPSHFEISENARTRECFNIGFVGGHNDTLRISMADQKVVDIIREAVLKTWAKGIKVETDYSGIIDMKLNGYPFQSTNSSSQEMDTRLMLCQILQDLLMVGWKPTCSIDHVFANKLQTWFFERCPEARSEVCCINISGSDEVQLVNLAEKAVCAVRDVLKSVMREGIKKEKSHGRNALLIELKGWIWTKNKVCSQLIDNRRAILQIIQEMEGMGYRLLLSTNIQSTDINCDSIFFHQSTGAGHRTDKMFLTPLSNDKLLMVECPGYVKELMKECIRDNWPDGVQDEGEEDGCPWIKIKGTPWDVTLQKTTAAARSLEIDIIRKLRRNGWKLVTGICLSKDVMDTGDLLFESCERVEAPVCAISFHHTVLVADLMRLYGGPPHLHDFVEKIGDRYIKGMAKVTKLEHNVHGEPITEFKFNGTPFNYGGGHDESRFRPFFCYMMAEMRRQLGWTVLASVDLDSSYVYDHNSKRTYPNDAHVVFLTPVEESLMPEKS